MRPITMLLFLVLAGCAGEDEVIDVVVTVGPVDGGAEAE